MRFCAYQYIYIGGGLLCFFQKCDSHDFPFPIAFSGLGWLHYSLIALILANGVFMMVSQRKFLDIDRHPAVSYRSTVKDVDLQLDSGHVDFCTNRTEKKTVENCSQRSATKVHSAKKSCKLSGILIQHCVFRCFCRYLDRLTVVYPPDLRSLGLATFIKEVEESFDSRWSNEETRQMQIQERLVSEYFVSNLEDLKIKIDHSVRSHVHTAAQEGNKNMFAASSDTMQGVVLTTNGSVLYIADGARGFHRPGAGPDGWKKNLAVRDLLEAAGLGPGALDAPFEYKSGLRSLRRHGLVVQVQPLLPVYPPPPFSRRRRRSAAAGATSRPRFAAALPARVRRLTGGARRPGRPTSGTATWGAGRGPGRGSTARSSRSTSPSSARSSPAPSERARARARAGRALAAPRGAGWATGIIAPGAMQSVRACARAWGWLGGRVGVWVWVGVWVEGGRSGRGRNVRLP